MLAVDLLDLGFRVFLLLILARVVLSWVPDLAHRFPSVTYAVWRFTSPVLDPVRRLLPPVAGLDLSPIVAILLLQLLVVLLREVLFSLL
ncbi:MAG: YggT family protein [Armatimonadota bacterium]|nr:YggT family protein [Armatimonadota bacterium]MDR7532511.1 YggT family protein [Armatimonadota bacterium]MDR7535598.1 YggT family protein [Armatimonadota bacterium]